MFAALLPGVREFRTPLITGALWVACAWILLGAKIVDSKSTVTFVHRLHLDGLPSAVWFGAGALLVYLIGSLLVVRSSPVAWFRPRITRVTDRLDLDVLPKRVRFRPIWRLWRHRRCSRLARAVRGLGENSSGRLDAVDSWLHNEFQSLMSDGRVPVMRSFRGGCDAPTGFRAFFSTESMFPIAAGELEDIRYELADQFVRQIKGEQSQIEVRIKMRFPEVYAEIDRLRVEGEMRLSIFWPWSILSVMLAFAWSPFALALLVVPPWLLRDGFRKMREASANTWGALIAREVTSPTLDVMESAKREECQSFVSMYAHVEPSAVLAPDQRPLPYRSGMC